MSVLEFSGSSNKNFSIRDGMAYTEDDVLVFDIFVSRLHKKLTQEDVRNYFTKFGELQSVRLVADKNFKRRSAPKLGFVSFKEASCAAKALMKHNHRLRGQRINVKAGDSWFQPLADQTCDDECSIINPNIGIGTNILSINDDCLEHILTFLNLREKIRFARVCQRFHGIFQMYCKRVFKSFDLLLIEHNMTLWDIRDFFRIAGENIEKLNGNIAFENRNRIIEFIRIYCKNLKHLCLQTCKVQPEVLHRLLGSLNDVKEICFDSCSLSDKSIRSLLQLKRLEILGLPNNCELTGRYLKNFGRLKDLNLYGCRNVQSKHLIEACKSIQGLKTLDIRHCDRVSSPVFDTMADHCLQLEVLKISCPDLPYERVAQIPSLKDLELFRYTVGTGISRTQIFEDLAKYKGNQLESLKIVSKDALNAERIQFISKLKKLKSLLLAYNHGVDDAALQQLCNLDELQEVVLRHCLQITNEGILTLLRNCTNLRCINVQHCRNINLELISKAINLLEPRKDTLKTPVSLLAYGTSITEDDLSLISEYNENVRACLLKVDFGQWEYYSLWDFFNQTLEADSDEDFYVQDYDDFESDEDERFYIPSDMDDDEIYLAYDMYVYESE